MTRHQTLVAQLADAMSRPHVRQRLLVPDHDTVSMTRLRQAVLDPDHKVAQRAIDAVLFIIDDWPADPATTAALIVAAFNAPAGGHEPPVERVDDPRLVLWLLTNLRPPAPSQDVEEVAA